MIGKAESNRRWRLSHSESAREISKKSNKKWLEKVKHPCPFCGVMIGHKAQTCRKHKPMRRGKYANNWKGGKVNSSGYTLIMKPEHTRADGSGYVREHILVWEEVNKRPLPSGWNVHHLNGVKSDNRPSNLIGLTSLKHSLVLPAKARRIQELETLLKHHLISF